MPQMREHSHLWFRHYRYNHYYRLEELSFEIRHQLVPRIGDLRHALAIICHDIKANELSCSREVYLRLLLATEYCLANGWRGFVYLPDDHFRRDLAQDYCQLIVHKLRQLHTK